MSSSLPSDRTILACFGARPSKARIAPPVAAAGGPKTVDGLPSETLSLYGQKIGKVTAADVDAAAQKYFPASRMTVVAVGEEKLIRDSLAPFGIPIQPAP